MANVQGKFYRGETQRSGVTPTSPPNAVDEPVGPLNPPGSGNTTTYKQLGDTTDKSFIGKNGYVPVVVNENQLTLQPLPNADQDGLISGGIVQWTGVDYDFNVSAALARFQGVFPLNSDPDILTLTTPDATNDRIDLFILQILFDGDGIPNGMEADFITGTPAGSPIKPQINPATQIELTSVLVTAGSTTPTLTEEVVYDENTEWTGSTAGTGTGVFNSAVDPYQGSVSVETTNIQNGFQVQFNNGSEIDISTYQTFGFQINLKASLGANQNLYVTFLDGSLAPVSNFVLINLNKALTGYQFIGIALNAVTFTSFDVQYIRFSFVRTSGPATFSGYFLDIVKLEGGIAPPVTQNTFLNLADTPSSYIGQASKVVSVKSDETGLEFTTASGGGGTDSNAVHYNVADGKTASEQEQARVNINSVEQPHMIEAVTGAQIDDLARTSKSIVFSGVNATNITGIAAGTDGDILNIYCDVTNGIVLLSQNAASVATNRFDFNATIRVGLSITLFYYNNRWRHFNSGSYINKSNADVSYFSTSYDGAAAGTVMLRIRQAGVQTAQWNAGGNITSTGITCTTVSASGIIIHARSNASDRSIRRDEKFLNTFENIATAGSINNQAITAGVFAQRFTAATELTGSANGENGRELTIFNNTGGNLTLKHESASSTAANRYYIIGAADLVIPDRGIATLIYTANSRWELKSKNF